MPVHTGKDSKGCFAQWGDSGAKYYYTCGNKDAMGQAKNKAYKQAIAIGKGKLPESQKESIDIEVEEFVRKIKGY